jgi:hypothetical protein
MRHVLIVAAALLSIGAAAPAQQAETISGNVRSWGKVLKAFEIDPSGEVRYTVAEQDGGFHDYWLVTRRAQAGGEAYRKVSTLTAEARALNGKSWDCTTGPTDGPYGELRWGGEHIDFNSGCIAPETDTVSAAIHDGLALAAEWAEKGEVVSREWKGPSRQ